MTFTLPLEDVDRTLTDQVGGKAANLGELIRSGINVPPAFVITVDAFRKQFSGQKLLQPGWEFDRRYLDQRSADSVAPDIARAIDEALEQTFGASNNPAALWVVRSSATREDSAELSFAGQHATYYYIQRDTLLQAVMNCWLSLFDPQARKYRSAHGVDHIPDMAVIVQRMVAAEVSGLTFTRDPTGSDDNELVIEATWGLGATLVDGRVSPDQYRVSRRDLTLTTRRIAVKSVKLAEDLIDHQKTRLEPVPMHQQRAATLNNAEVAQLAKLALGCESHFGQPQDVEWAMQNGQIYLLQSRPITAAPVPQKRDISGRWVAFKPILENFTEPLTPLSIDLFRYILGPSGAFIDGRYYLNFDLLSMLTPLKTSDAERVSLALFQSTPADYPLQPGKLVFLAVALLPAYLSFGNLLIRTRRLSDNLLKGFKHFCNDLLQNQRVSPLDALRQLFMGRHPYARISDFMLLINLSCVRYFFLLPLLHWWLRRFVPDLDPAIVAPLCAGNENMKSTELIDDLKHLAETAEATPAVAQILLGSPPGAVLQQLANLKEATVFNQELQAYLETYGHRTAREMELATPRWHEDPAPLIAMLANFLRTAEGNIDKHRSREALTASHASLSAAIPGKVHRRWIYWLISRIRYYATLRENSRFYHTMVMDVVRRKILDIEQILIRKGSLKCPDDIFYLTWKEIDALRQDTLGWRDVERRIQRRRIRNQRLGRSQPAFTFNIDIPARPETDTLGSLTGQCACPGIAEGVARIIRDPAEDGCIEAGEILIAPYTDPAWTPLFPLAGAVVVEVGSYLSHAGTVAREFNVPCVVDVRGCVEKIHSGQRVRVNATDGRVEVLDKAT